MENIYEHITVAQFGQIRAILCSDRQPEDKMIAIASTLQGISEAELLDMDLNHAREVFAVMGGLDEKPKAARIRKVYHVGPWKLRVCEAQDMCVAQWVDYQQFLRQGAEEHMTDTLSVALVPDGKKYNEGYDIAQLRKDIAEKMSMADALAVCFFFQKKWLKSMRRTLTYLVGWTSMKGQKELKERALRVRGQVSDMLHSL